jgi:hypothetical protein
MFKSEARGVRGRRQADWEWKQAWSNDADEEGAADGEAQAAAQTLWEAEMWALWQQEARRSRSQRRGTRDRDQRE